ncbi:unnamed protein product, partial [Musa hybrid cultivar]
WFSHQSRLFAAGGSPDRESKLGVKEPNYDGKRSSLIMTHDNCASTAESQ